MSKVLFISKLHPVKNGAAHITLRNKELLKDYYGHESVFVYNVAALRSDQRVKRIFNTFRNYSGDLTKKHENEICQVVRDRSIKIVFLDTSLFGRLSKTIKLLFSEVLVYTFFHNIEIAYFSSYSNATKRFWHRIYSLSCSYNESLAVKYSDALIVLNQRDAVELKKIYERCADLILPTTFEDKFNITDKRNTEQVSPFLLQLLFVGSNFFANVHGLSWFVQNVLTKVSGVHLKVVGNGMEALKPVYREYDNIDVVGGVEDLSCHYYNSDIVVAPIFVGSGMKTKTAEALMYGRSMLATKEAMEGYEYHGYEIGCVTDDAKEMIEFLKLWRGTQVEKFNRDSRKLYEEKFSHKQALDLFSAFDLTLKTKDV